jgi:hypothetical protein
MADENGTTRRGYVLFAWSPAGYELRDAETDARRCPW